MEATSTDMPRQTSSQRASVVDRLRYQLRPGTWFWLALIVLLPVQGFSTLSDEWLWSPPKPDGDGCDYENIAYHLSVGRGFVFDNTDPAWRQIYAEQPAIYAVQLQASPRNLPATGRPPLLPIMVGGIYRVLGRNAHAFATVRIILAVCLVISGSLAVFVTARLLVTSPLSWAGCAGCLATLAFAASNRTLRSYATDFLTEPLALLLTELFVVCAIVMCQASPDADGPRTQRWPPLWAGLAVGGMILTRSMFVLWLPAIWLLWFVSRSGSAVVRLQSATLVVGLACLVCAPWWIRNVVVLQRFMPLGTQGPITLLGGYSDAALQSNGDWQFDPELRLRAELQKRPDFRAAPSDLDREKIVADVARQRVKSWITEHPGKLLGLATKRVYVHWNPYTGRSLFWKLAIVLGAVGLLVHRRRAAWWLLGLPLWSTIVVAALYSVGGRFLVPLYGVLFTLAGLGLAGLLGAKPKR
jgi:hypothetical protein